MGVLCFYPFERMGSVPRRSLFLFLPSMIPDQFVSRFFFFKCCLSPPRVCVRVCGGAYLSDLFFSVSLLSSRKRARVREREELTERF